MKSLRRTGSMMTSRCVPHASAMAIMEQPTELQEAKTTQTLTRDQVHLRLVPQRPVILKEQNSMTALTPTTVKL